jgi:nitrogen fixation-related uncharacterized protein
MVAASWCGPASEQRSPLLSPFSQSRSQILVVSIVLGHLVFSDFLWKTNFTYFPDENYSAWQKLQNKANCAYRLKRSAYGTSRPSCGVARNPGAVIMQAISPAEAGWPLTCCYTARG